jgi:hypothetical protein
MRSCAARPEDLVWGRAPTRDKPEFAPAVENDRIRADLAVMGGTDRSSPFQSAINDWKSSAAVSTGFVYKNPRNSSHWIFVTSLDGIRIGSVPVCADNARSV